MQGGSRSKPFREHDMSIASSIHDLKTLVLSFHPVIVINTVEEARVSSLLASVTNELRMTHFEWTITRGLQKLPGDGSDTTSGWTTDPFQLLAHLEQMSVDAIFHLKDFVEHLTEPTTIRKFSEVARHMSRSRTAIVLSGSDCNLPDGIVHHSVHLDLALPGMDELRPMFHSLIRSLEQRGRVRVDLSLDDAEALLRAASGLTLNQARQVIARAALENGVLSISDVADIHDHKAELLRDGGLLEYFPAEDNRTELGGFAGLKRWLDRAKIGFSAEARELNLTAPRGVLLVGVQGCGKSLAAKTVARQWQLPLIKLDAGSLYDKYIGETEKNFRRATDLASSLAPVVLWIDELEKAFAPSGGSDADGGVSRRVFGTFLTWLQEKQAEVFVVATANDLSSLPPELLRKGRFDEIFFVDLPDAAERSQIFEIHLRLRKQDPGDVDLLALVEASDGMSGAEIEQAVISSLYESLYRKRELDTATLLTEIDSMVPLSVSHREKIEHLRQMGRDRFIPVR